MSYLNNNLLSQLADLHSYIFIINLETIVKV